MVPTSSQIVVPVMSRMATRVAWTVILPRMVMAESREKTTLVDVWNTYAWKNCASFAASTTNKKCN